MTDVEPVVAFLHAAHAEIERVASQASGPEWSAYDDDPEYGRLFHMGDYGWSVREVNAAPKFSPFGVETEDSEQGKIDATHIALHDPRSALARVQSERRLVEELVEIEGSAMARFGYGDPGLQETARDHLRLLAYGHRFTIPGFDLGWTPEGAET